MLTFTSKADAAQYLCIAADQLLSAVASHMDDADNPHLEAVEKCLRHLDDGADLHTAHALVSAASAQAPSDSGPQTCPGWGLCALLAMAMEHPAFARFAALPTHHGRAGL